MRHVGTTERRALLAERHRLRPERRTNDVVAIADDLVALHSSDPTTVFLSVLARMIEPASDAVERVLYEARSLLRYHAMRRTIWVANPSLVVAMNAASTRKIAAAERKKLLGYFTATEGIDDAETELARIDSEILALLAADGPLTTREIGIRRPDLTRKITVGSGKHTIEAGAHTKVASVAGFEGRLFRGRPSGTWVGSEYTWHLPEEWTSIDLDELDERMGAEAVIRAWLGRFGPGSSNDLQWWTGWTATTTRRALADVDALEVSLDGNTTGWILPDDPLLDSETSAVDEPWVAVLPGLDPTTMGWKERGWYLSDAANLRVFDRNGNAGPTIWCNGEVVGGWVQLPDGELAVELVQPLDPHEQSLLDAELNRLREAIGEARFRVRFPSPNQKDLLG